MAIIIDNSTESNTDDDMIPNVMGYTFAIYPTPAQERKMNRVFGCCRFIFNQYVNWREWEYQHNYNDKQHRAKKNGIRSQLCSKNKKQYPWLGNAPSGALQAAVEAADDAYWAMVKTRKAGEKYSTPRRRKYGDQSFRLPGKCNFKIRETDHKRHRGHVYIPKVGWVRYRAGRDLREASSIGVKRTRAGMYSASAYLPTEMKEHKLDAADRIGIDVGLDTLVVGSDTNARRWDIATPKFYRKAERTIAKAQRRVNRRTHDVPNSKKKDKSSKGRARAQKQLAKAHKKAKNQRKDYLHKVTTIIADNNHAVVMETLDIVGMTKNHKLAKSIHDASWGTLMRMLDYKEAVRGGTTIHLDRWLPTSQTCAPCGHRDSKKTLDVRVWECPNCHTVLDRDHNSSTFIMDAGGHSESLNACGGDVSRWLSAPLSSLHPVGLKQEYFCNQSQEVSGDNPMLTIVAAKKKPLP